MAMRKPTYTLKDRLADPDRWPGWPLLHVRCTVDGKGDQDGTIHARMGLFRVILTHPDKTGIKSFDEFEYVDYPTFEALEEAGWKPVE